MSKRAALARAALVRGASLFALSSLFAASAFASDRETLEEIRSLKAKLQQLEHRLDAQAQIQRRDTGKAAHGPATVAATTKSGDERPWPDKFFYKGITITPGGFFAAESVYRSRWLGADIDTPYQNIPFAQNVAGHTNEFRFSARQSRLSMRVDGDIDPATHVFGYVESDFLGAAQTANSNESNSYNPRMRHLFANLDLNEFGLHLLGGQTWSLATMNEVGLRPDKVNNLPNIDAQYFVGYVWTRQPQLRIVKDVTKDISIGFSVENPASTVIAAGPPTFVGTSALPLVGAPFLSAPAVGGGLFNAANAYTFNRMPDFVAKAAWDPTFADRTFHVEAFGVLRDFTDRIYWGNQSVWAGGFGGGVIAPVIPKFLDVQLSGMIGRGIGRYASGQINDAAYSALGAPLPIHERMILVGATLHATPQTDVYAFAGGEFASPDAQFSNNGPTVIAGGYGNFDYNNTGCFIENEPGTLPAALTNCAGQIKSIRQLTGGIWHTFYQGPYGKIKAGAQYSYVVKDAFQGVGGAPKATENMLLTSVRYYPF
jgi:hypothetical protein